MAKAGDFSTANPATQAYWIWYQGYSYFFPACGYDMVAVLSDGAASFIRQHRAETSIIGEAVPLAEILPRLIGFKSTAPGFAVRRLLRLRAEFAREGILHTNDISVAAIAITRTEE